MIVGIVCREASFSPTVPTIISVGLRRPHIRHHKIRLCPKSSSLFASKIEYSFLHLELFNFSFYINDANEGVSKCALVEYNAKTRASRDDTAVSSAAFLERLYSSDCIMCYARSERADDTGVSSLPQLDFIF